MFLGELNNQEKRVFWGLAKQIINADGVITDEEKEMMNQYQTEMGEAFHDDEVESTIDESIKKLSALDDRTVKIIYFELLGLAYSDNDFADEERNVLNKIGDEVGLDRKTRESLTECVDQIFDIYTRIAGIINE